MNQSDPLNESTAETQRAMEGPPPTLSDPGPFVRFLKTVLEPVILQRLLALGGGLFVLGLIIGLASQGVFDDPRIAAAALGTGSLSVLGLGWWLLLRTKHGIAGRAMTFLGCVVLPLNLWFYHSQGLVSIDQHLWVGGVVCVLVYLATVYRLKEPNFLYAVQVGTMLTLLLMLGDMNLIQHLNWISTSLMFGGLASLHAVWLFPKSSSIEFSRERYSLPLFVGGTILVSAGLLVMMLTQFITMYPTASQIATEWGTEWNNSEWWAIMIWVCGSYAFSYSTVVRRQSIWIAPATLCAVGVVFQTLGLTHWIESWRTVAVALLGCLSLAMVRLFEAGQSEAKADGGSTERVALPFEVATCWVLFIASISLPIQMLLTMGSAERWVEHLWPSLVGSIVVGIAATFAPDGWKRVYVSCATIILAVVGVTFALHSQISLPRKVECYAFVVGVLCLIIGYVQRWREIGRDAKMEATAALWLGSVLVAGTITVGGIVARANPEYALPIDAPLVLIGSMSLIALGVASQVKATTLTGSVSLTTYLLVLLTTLLRAADLSVGIYLGVGGAFIFVAALVLSLYRDRILSIPEHVEKRTGIFRVLDWR